LKPVVGYKNGETRCLPETPTFDPHH